MKPLELALSKSKHLSKQSIGLFSTFWTKSKTLKPRETLIDFDSHAPNLYFVVDGCVRLFIVDDLGDEINIGFGYRDSFITSFQSFIEEKPSMLSIEAVLETDLISISKKKLAQLTSENKEIANWYQSMLETTLSGHIQRQVELLTLKPAERYEVFIKRSGHLINALPLKLIASYLMMTPETLSRIRAKLS
ncbi:Crp/Fnr family transcriptional regulator [uncultured Imperialibacter sp.]|uniref:Crp/Fnr family transcriptional regulator n=1 Tax=uncultured Imperialibacter sp. TaxID=1672639 RepID=UPI0030DBEBB0|tara:strand:+ start:10967 stop:11539 length:573 start_codon:yes stop_codon:yes gene_type:complete